MPHSIKKILTAAVSLVCVAAFTFLAVAWFSGFGYHGSVSFMPGSNAGLPAFNVWMYYSADDKAENNDTVTPEGWVDQRVGFDGDNMAYVTFPAVVSQPNGDNISYQLSSLHFGKVDNLVTLHEDNKIYFRFHITPDVLTNDTGVLSEIALTLAYNTSGYSYDQDTVSIFDSFHLYKEATGLASNEVDLKIPANQDDIEDAISNNQVPPKAVYVLEHKDDNPAALQFIQMRYAVSTGKYTPNDFPAELEFSEVIPINCGSNGAAECDACNDNRCGKAILDLTNAGLDNENRISDSGFYVYLELAPLLDAFSMQENILDYFVPAYMLFDVKLDIEIK